MAMVAMVGVDPPSKGLANSSCGGTDLKMGEEENEERKVGREGEFSWSKPEQVRLDLFRESTSYS